jgi:hypothetical protein
VGCTFAALPMLIVRGVALAQTGSAMSFNQVVRYVGYSTGSALSATVLQAHTARGRVLPTLSGYTDVVRLGLAICLVTAAISLLLPRFGSRKVSVADEELLIEEAVVDSLTYDAD